MKFTAIILLATALRLFGLGTESFWFDEAWSAWLIEGTPQETVNRLVEKDAHPPLYYLLLSGWSTLAGTTESDLRALSVLFGVLTVAWLYRLVRRIISETAAVAAALLLAVSPFHVYFSQEARSYALVMLLCVIALDLLTADRLRQLPLALVTAALVYSHYMTVFFIASVGLWIVLARRDQFWRFAVAMIGAALFFAPWMGVAYKHLTLVHGSFWIPPVTPHRVVESLGELLVRFWGWPAYLFALWLLVMILARGAGRLVLLGWCLFAVPIILEILISFGRPLFYTRTFGYALVGAILLAAMAVDRLRFGRAWTLLLALTALPGLGWIHFKTEKEDWRGVARAIQERAHPQDFIVAEPVDVAVCLRYYKPAIPIVPLYEIPYIPHGIWVISRYGAPAGIDDTMNRSILSPGREFEYRRNGAEVIYFLRGPWHQ